MSKTEYKIKDMWGENIGTIWLAPVQANLLAEEYAELGVSYTVNIDSSRTLECISFVHKPILQQKPESDPTLKEIGDQLRALSKSLTDLIHQWKK